MNAQTSEDQETAGDYLSADMAYCGHTELTQSVNTCKTVLSMAVTRPKKHCLLGSGDVHAQVLGAGRISCDERQVDVCLSG